MIVRGIDQLYHGFAARVITLASTNAATEVLAMAQDTYGAIVPSYTSTPTASGPLVFRSDLAV